jgi:hypothetical protein
MINVRRFGDPINFPTFPTQRLAVKKLELEVFASLRRKRV